jgi:Rieske Fe-S protein
MFEVPVDKQEAKSKYERLGVSILVLMVIAGAAFYFLTKQSAKPQPAPVAAAPTAPADPIHDLKIVRVTMNKDPMGTTAVWLVTLQNKSAAYTYSNIHYETNYIGPDDKSILVNQGSIPESFSPGDEHNSQIRDTLYPNGTAWYKFKIVDAKASER